MEDLEMTCFQIISNVGTARSSYIEAIQKAKQGDFEGARESVSAGQKEFLKGHEAHFSLLQKEAQGVMVGGSLILIHAEDQLMSAENFKIIAEEMIANYEKMAELEKRLESQRG
ncbi:MAG: PTS lactose/cellobiose transporter subunit IIA [Lachnospiraceae bacterium]|nr:PTS lactose/cellobiose transporter subunit IIA [Lachnospiraceae bacterium]MCI9183941.1 PTS lactose/cellobiose transporter subunit IIA [Lachnospiraceae bacterium]